jgi:hypothetical protein
MKTAYTYTLLRYVHDVTSGEFANVGVVLFAPDARYAGAICRDTLGRLSRMFPDMDRDGFKSLMRYIESRVDAMGERLRGELPLETMPTDAGFLARSVLPHDDSSLQWGPVGGGLCADPTQKLEELFLRYITRYDEKNDLKTRTDDEVWSRFKRALDEKHVTSRLTPKKISVADDEVEFARAYKNEQWHCIEPVSFDLALPDSIKHKAHQWLGQITSVRGAEPFRVYFLVGAPKAPELHDSFRNALKILHKVPVEHEIVPEDSADTFADRFGKLITAHEGAVAEDPPAD